MLVCEQRLYDVRGNGAGFGEVIEGMSFEVRGRRFKSEKNVNIVYT